MTDKEVKQAANVLAVPFAHAALLVIWLLPYFVEINANFNVILTAATAVYVGCWRSVKPVPSSDSMTKQDAMRFPIVGSVVLFGLFILFKFLPKDLVNAVLTFYFLLLGNVAITAVGLPFVLPLFPERLRELALRKKIKIPYVETPLELEFTVPEAVMGSLCSGFCVWYYCGKPWLANNLLGLAFAVEGVEFLALGSVQTGTILLAGLFFYDIFWVFCTPVMVTVAKSFDAPIKLLFPRGLGATGAQNFGMLGLGDIVIPGIFVALMLRYDVAKEHKTPYFKAAYIGYVMGLVATILVMNVFHAAQPALLYIVPAVLGSVALVAAWRGEFTEVFSFEETPPAVEGQAGEGEGAKKGEGDDKVAEATDVSGIQGKSVASTPVAGDGASDTLTGDAGAQVKSGVEKKKD